MTEILQFVKDYGFPIAVAAYLLIRMETTIKSMSDAQNKTNQILAAFMTIIEKCTKKE